MIDILVAQEDGSINSHGGVAQKLLDGNFNLNSLRTNATLQKDEWELIDKTVVQVGRERLQAVADLFSNNLTFDVPNAMGTLVITHETVTEMVAAQIDMDGVTKGPNDRILFAQVNTPLPIIHHDFQITARTLAASRKSGIPLDTAQIAEATRQVSESIEVMLLNGHTAGDILGFGSSTAQLFGYTNRTNRNTISLSVQWDTSATGSIILADVLSMISAAQDDRMYGPYMLYVPTNYWITLLDDFKTNSDKTIIQRVKEIPNIMDVKVLDKLADDNVLLVQMTSNNVDMAVGMQPTVVQWEGQGGMVFYFKVMAIMVPRIKLDAGNRSGVVHLS